VIFVAKTGGSLASVVVSLALQEEHGGQSAVRFVKLCLPMDQAVQHNDLEFYKSNYIINLLQPNQKKQAIKVVSDLVQAIIERNDATKKLMYIQAMLIIHWIQYRILF
jgi:hypothetical protein